MTINSSDKDVDYVKLFFRDILTLVLEKYTLISEALAKLVKFITRGYQLVQSEKLPRNVDVRF